MHGVLNLLKPPGMTSHDAVAFVRRVLKNRRVGHTGTLDPAAAGVLPVCVGQATRLVEYLQAGRKRYEAEATFGFETDTLDLVGSVVRECDASGLSLETLNQVLGQFRGRIEQIPPMHSAIKVGGQKLYDLARAGEEVEIPVRVVEIFALEVVRFESGLRPRVWLRIECSGGTYIRSLIRDIGVALNLAATMTFLVRTQSGEFDLERATPVEEFAQAPVLFPLVDVLTSRCASVHVDDNMAIAFLQGKRVNDSELGAATKRKGIALVSSLLEDSRLVMNSAHSILALVVPCEESPHLYRAEKVFDLR